MPPALLKGCHDTASTEQATGKSATFGLIFRGNPYCLCSSPRAGRKTLNWEYSDMDGEFPLLSGQPWRPEGFIWMPRSATVIATPCSPRGACAYARAHENSPLAIWEFPGHLQKWLSPGTPQGKSKEDRINGIVSTPLPPTKRIVFP